MNGTIVFFFKFVLFQNARQNKKEHTNGRKFDGKKLNFENENI